MVLIVLYTFSYGTTEEVAENLDVHIQNNVTSTSTTTATPSTEKSFMSKLANWIFPFNNSEDTETSETRRVGSEYLPPQNHFDRDCNPCNREPWIPVAAQYGKNTLIGFVQPSDYNKQIHLGNGGSYLENLQPPQPHIDINYGPPDIQNYGVPKPPSNNYGPPLQVPYGPPQPIFNVQNHRRPKIPPFKFGQPKLQHAHPSNQHYLTKFHPPPPNRPHRINSKYKPQKLPNFSVKPPGNYGPPPLPPSNNYGPPLKLPPLNNYGPPPSNHYGPPLKLPPSNNYGPPINGPSKNNGPSISVPPSNNYGAPPSNNYDPPISGPPSNDYGVPLNAHGPNLAPPPQNNYSPSSFGNTLQQNFIPPPPSSNYLPPTQASQLQLPAAIPSDSYGKPVLGPDASLANVLKNEPLSNDYLPPIEQLPQSSSIEDATDVQTNNVFFHKPIPFPNLSSLPVLPLHDYQNFHPELLNSAPDSFVQQSSGVPLISSNYGQVEVIKSVPVAGYLASIEHPINVIQSPLVEVQASAFNENQDDKLSDNPIVVDDTHVSASSNNASVIKRDNDKDLGIVVNINEVSSTAIPNLQETSLFNPEIVNNILDHSNVIKDASTAAPFIWEQSKEFLTSLTPPPKGDSPWLSSIGSSGKVLSSTMKTPKQIQIIIPYINDKPTPFQMSSTTKLPNVSTSIKSRKELPLYTIPPTTESVWLQHSDYHASASNLVTYTQQPSTVVTNIRDYLDSKTRKPFDILKLQKHIDNWTQQEYSKKLPYINYDKISTVSKLVPSKIIPEEYLTTPSYPETTTLPKEVHTTKEEDVESNLILDSETTPEITTIEETTTQTTSTTKAKVLYGTIHSVNDTKLTWDKLKLEKSNKEKIYVVTPQPINYGFFLKKDYKKKNVSFAGDKFTVSLDKLHSKEKNGTDLKIVLSEWPHLSKAFFNLIC